MVFCTLNLQGSLHQRTFKLLFLLQDLKPSRLTNFCGRKRIFWKEFECYVYFEMMLLQGCQVFLHVTKPLRISLPKAKSFYLKMKNFLHHSEPQVFGIHGKIKHPILDLFDQISKIRTILGEPLYPEYVKLIPG